MLVWWALEQSIMLQPQPSATLLQHLCEKQHAQLGDHPPLKRPMLLRPMLSTVVALQTQCSGINSSLRVCV
jgi:hypothetical protein